MKTDQRRGMDMRMRSLWRITAIVCIVGLAAAACGDDSDDVTPGDDEAPIRGGSISIGTFSQVQGLDPLLTNGAASNGGMENAALYDRLIIWNPQTQSYEPNTAESVEPNADFTEWTITIREGIQFTDGTAYDAEAVAFNIERQRDGSNILRGVLAIVDVVTALDERTVRVTLSEPFAGFQFLLANAVGMIVSPTALETLGDDFAINPVGAGAGPFQISEFRPGEAIIMVRNPDYWGGEVYLDEIRFVQIPAGADATYDAVRTGQLQAAFLREPSAVIRSQEDSMPGFETIMSMGEMYLINNGLPVTCSGGSPVHLCEGEPDGTVVAADTPGTDPRVRQAIHAAVDLEEVDRRANDGRGIPAYTLFHDSLPWAPDTPVPGHDVELARRLVDEAKADGWDGSIRLKCNDSPSRQGATLAVDAMLRAAGFTVELSIVPDVMEVVTDVIINRDYDIACWGITVSPDDGAVVQLESFLHGNSGSNRTGYGSPDMDAALVQLKAAGTDADRQAAYAEIARIWNRDVPAVTVSQLVERVVWRPEVRGVVGTSLTTADFRHAWISQ